MSHSVSSDSYHLYPGFSLHVSNLVIFMQKSSKVCKSCVNATLKVQISLPSDAVHSLSLFPVGVSAVFLFPLPA